jgi:hypothetical protein
VSTSTKSPSAGGVNSTYEEVFRRTEEVLERGIQAISSLRRHNFAAGIIKLSRDDSTRLQKYFAALDVMLKTLSKYSTISFVVFNPRYLKKDHVDNTRYLRRDYVDLNTLAIVVPFNDDYTYEASISVIDEAADMPYEIVAGIDKLIDIPHVSVYMKEVPYVYVSTRRRALKTNNVYEVKEFLHETAFLIGCYGSIEVGGRGPYAYFILSKVANTNNPIPKEVKVNTVVKASCINIVDPFYAIIPAVMKEAMLFINS